ncbi:MAG: helix-turn-helix domain-containing protein [Thermoleophilia bacterium]
MGVLRTGIATKTSAQATPRLALTPDQAAEALGVSRDTLERHILGELRVVRRGRRILISVAELERWLDANSTALFGSRRG